MNNTATTSTPTTPPAWDAEVAFTQRLISERNIEQTYSTHTDVVRHGASPDESKTILTVQKTWGQRDQYEAPTWRRNRVVGIDPGELLDRLNVDAMENKRIIADWARIEAAHGEEAGLAAAITMYVALNCEIDAKVVGSGRRFITHPNSEG